MIINRRMRLMIILRRCKLIILGGENDQQFEVASMQLQTVTMIVTIIASVRLARAGSVIIGQADYRAVRNDNHYRQGD
jgi:hypothetical protein